MSEFEERLNAILSDPGELEKIGRLAASLMGEGQPPEETGAPGAPEAAFGLPGGFPGKGIRGDGGKGALLAALAPYLKPERQARLRKALRLAGLLRVAWAALGEAGGEGDL